MIRLGIAFYNIYIHYCIKLPCYKHLHAYVVIATCAPNDITVILEAHVVYGHKQHWLHLCTDAKSSKIF